jgi:hypothetical protein
VHRNPEGKAKLKAERAIRKDRKAQGLNPKTGKAKSASRVAAGRRLAAANAALGRGALKNRKPRTTGSESSTAMQL